MNTEKEEVSQNKTKTRLRVMQILIRILLIAVLIGTGAWTARYLIKNKPKVPRESRQPAAPLVQVISVKPDREQIRIEGMGTVKPSRTVVLTSRVNGVVDKTAGEFDPGKLFKAGSPLVWLEKDDYQLAVKQRTLDIARAQSGLALEKGRHAVAVQETELLDTTMTREDRVLATREPQLAASRAQLALAETAFEKAQLDLKRTEITAPMDCVVNERNVSAGAVISTSTPLAHLTGTDIYWIEVTVPVDHLRWIAIPEKGEEQGSKARVYYRAAWGEGKFREGIVTRLLPELVQQGRLARLLIAVKDPLCLTPENKGLPRFILSAFVRVEIFGLWIDNVLKIPSSALHDGNTVWVAVETKIKGKKKPEHIMEIRQVNVIWRMRDSVLIDDGIKEHEKIIVSDLSTPVSGMRIKTPDKTGGLTPSKKKDQRK